MLSKQIVEFVSEAQRDSEIIRGQGDAERNRIFGEAFQRDPRIAGGGREARQDCG